MPKTKPKEKDPKIERENAILKVLIDVRKGKLQPCEGMDYVLYHLNQTINQEVKEALERILKPCSGEQCEWCKGLGTCGSNPNYQERINQELERRKDG